MCISLSDLDYFLSELAGYVILLGTGQFRWSIGTNGTIGTNRKAHHSNGSTSEYASH